MIGEHWLTLVDVREIPPSIIVTDFETVGLMTPQKQPTSQLRLFQIQGQRVFVENTHTLSRQAAATLSVSLTWIIKTLKENQMHHYKFVSTQDLIENDLNRRTYFSERMLDLSDKKEIQIENVLFSDKCTFTLLGHTNRP